MSGGGLVNYASFFLGSTAFLLLLVWGTWWVSRRWSGPPVWRSRLVNAALVLMSATAPLVAAEGWLLLFVDTTDNGLLTLTSQRWLERHAPGLGLRGRKGPSADTGKRPTLFLAALGDSITYGQGVERDEDLYSSVLERELRLRGIRADVYNLSRPGWNTPDEVAELRRQLEAGAVFDAVVLGFCFNDIGKSVGITPAFHEAVDRLQNPPAALAPLLDRSFVASLLYNRIVTLASPEIGEAWKRTAEAFRVPEAFQQLAVQLAEAIELADDYGVTLIVATFPDLAYDWEHYPYRDVHRKLDAFWRESGVAHVDLLPAFERYPARSFHAGIMDAHPNETAHRLAGVEIARAMATVAKPAAPGAARP